MHAPTFSRMSVDKRIGPGAGGTEWGREAGSWKP